MPDHPILRDKDVGIWVCREAHDVEEFVIADGTPTRERCRQCGERYIKECENCRHPYHWSDYFASYHGCGAGIGWFVPQRLREAKWPDPVSKLLDKPWTRPPNEEAPSPLYVAAMKERASGGDRDAADRLIEMRMEVPPREPSRIEMIWSNIVEGLGGGVRGAVTAAIIAALAAIASFFGLTVVLK